MSRKSPNLLGKRFYSCVVINKAPKSEKNKTRWECRCDCGNIKIIGANELQSGNTKSCGCRKRRDLPKGDSLFHDIMRSYKIHAKERNLQFDLTKDDFRNLTQMVCFYCGIYPSTVRKRKENIFIYNGVDRLDNGLGYTLSNCVTCCRFCNSAKSDRSYNEFITWVERIHDCTISKRN